MSKPIEAEAAEHQFSVEQLLREKRGIEHDIWAAALKSGARYTMESAEAAVAAYLKKEVKK
jgi:hypothetical protein